MTSLLSLWRRLRQRSVDADLDAAAHLVDDPDALEHINRPRAPGLRRDLQMGRRTISTEWTGD
jgi:hypothetical protein